MVMDTDDSVVIQMVFDLNVYSSSVSFTQLLSDAVVILTRLQH